MESKRRGRKSEKKKKSEKKSEKQPEQAEEKPSEKQKVQQASDQVVVVSPSAAGSPRELSPQQASTSATSSPSSSSLGSAAVAAGTDNVATSVSPTLSPSGGGGKPQKSPLLFLTRRIKGSKKRRDSAVHSEGDYEATIEEEPGSSSPELANRTSGGSSGVGGDSVTQQQSDQHSPALSQRSQLSQPREKTRKGIAKVFHDLRHRGSKVRKSSSAPVDVRKSAMENSSDSQRPGSAVMADDDSFSSYATPMNSEAPSSGYSTPMFESGVGSPDTSLTESLIEEDERGPDVDVIGPAEARSPSSPSTPDAGAIAAGAKVDEAALPAALGAGVVTSALARENDTSSETLIEPPTPAYLHHPLETQPVDGSRGDTDSETISKGTRPMPAEKEALLKAPLASSESSLSSKLTEDQSPAVSCVDPALGDGDAAAANNGAQSPPELSTSQSLSSDSPSLTVSSPSTAGQRSIVTRGGPYPTPYTPFSARPSVLTSTFLSSVTSSSSSKQPDRSTSIEEIRFCFTEYKSPPSPTLDGDKERGFAQSLPAQPERMDPHVADSSNGYPKNEHLYKVLVIGELGTGKTSIIKRYVHQFFSQHYRATIGVDFALKVVHWDQSTVIRLQLWDIAGQERFGNMTRVYYKEAVGAFIVFDVTRTSTFESVAKWKQDLDAKVQLPDGSPIPCVLLANKCDQPKEGIVATPGKLDEYCKEKGFAGWFETSAKDNINIDDAAKFLVGTILQNDQWNSSVKEEDADKLDLRGGEEPAPKKGGCC